MHRWSDKFLWDEIKRDEDFCAVKKVFQSPEYK